VLDEWIRDITAKRDQGREKFSGWSKKGKYGLIILICLGLMALIWPSGKTQPQNSSTGTAASNARSAGGVKEQMISELESILSSVDGAGAVQVSLTLTSDGIKNYATNVREEKQDIEEKDNSGSQKKTAEQSIQRDLAVSGGDSLLVEQKYPEVVGVLVVADGASDPVIKEELTEAAVTLLNISSDRVRVLPRTSGKEE
jgi:stage III sporulation protein AG